MNGYLGNPKASADSFIDGWLKTGDVGTVDKQGRIFIVDRQKVRHPSYFFYSPFVWMLRAFARISSRVNHPSVLLDKS
jgi:acyl-CoA synthetase (AMP-forming)/AMP-acid ligase II